MLALLVEVGLLVAAELELGAHLSLLGAVASCPEACLTNGNGRKISFDSQTVLVIAALSTVRKRLEDPYVVSLAGVGGVGRWANRRRRHWSLSPRLSHMRAPVESVPLNRTEPSFYLPEKTPIVKSNGNLLNIHLSCLDRSTGHTKSKLVCFQKLSAVSKIVIVIRKSYRSVEVKDMFCLAASFFVRANLHIPALSLSLSVVQFDAYLFECWKTWSWRRCRWR